MRTLIFLLALCWTSAAFAQTPIGRTPQQIGDSLAAKHTRAFAKIKPRVASMIAHQHQHAAITDTPTSELATGPRPDLAELAATNPSNTICPVWLDVCNATH